MCGNPPLFSHSCLNLSCRTEPKQRHSDDKQTVVEGDPGKFMLWIKSVAQHEYPYRTINTGALIAYAALVVGDPKAEYILCPRSFFCCSIPANIKAIAIAT